MRTKEESDQLREWDPWCSCGHRMSKHTVAAKVGEDVKRPHCGITVDQAGSLCGCYGYAPDRILNQTGD